MQIMKNFTVINIYHSLCIFSWLCYFTMQLYKQEYEQSISPEWEVSLSVSNWLEIEAISQVTFQTDKGSDKDHFTTRSEIQSSFLTFKIVWLNNPNSRSTYILTSIILFITAFLTFCYLIRTTSEFARQQVSLCDNWTTPSANEDHVTC